jgi:hypothetical protein
MPVATRNNKTSKPRERESKADRLARALGGRPFDINEPVEDPGISDEELEDFLEWRREMRKADVEAQEKWLP